MESPQSRPERRLRAPDAPAPSSAGPSLVGDIAAIYAEHAGFVWRVLRGMGIAQAQIEDAVQDVFIVVHRRYAEVTSSQEVITYLKLTGCPAGLLLNFNATTLRAGLRRLRHPDLYVPFARRVERDSIHPE